MRAASALGDLVIKRYGSGDIPDTPFPEGLKEQARATFKEARAAYPDPKALAWYLVHLVDDNPLDGYDPESARVLNLFIVEACRLGLNGDLD